MKIMQNNKENLTVQELNTPVPAALVGVQTGPQSSRSNYRNTPLVANLAGGVDNITSINEREIRNPFGNSSKITRTPPKINYVPTQVAIEDIQSPAEQITYAEHINNDNKRLKMLQIEEEKAFVDLGSKLSIINAVATNAKNIHKPIRDNLVYVMALYQQMREYRDAIANNPITKAESNISHVPILLKDSQSDAPTPKNGTNNMEVRGKRLSSASPKSERFPKRPKTTDNQKISDNVKSINESDESAWKQVEHRKKNRKKKTESSKQRLLKTTGEALTIKAKESKTYAEMLKQMKSNINPSDLGVVINEMRRTKAGELLIKFKPGDGTADKLKEVLLNTLGEDVIIRSANNSVNIDIRDMDESTEEQEIINALMKTTGEQISTTFKILNIRESYGKTKQALVQMPRNVASKLLAERRISIGWIKCRVRATERIIKCFRCLDQGHLAKECNGIDRTDLCKRCCISGHKSNNCNQNPRCILCQEAGYKNFEHFIGSSLCVKNKRNKIANHV